MNGTCIHVILGFTSDEWKKLSPAEREKRAKDIYEQVKK